MTLISPTVHLLARPTVVPSALSVTRATPATRITPLGRVETVAADVPRQDYHPDTGAFRGWLVEEARTNRILYSQAFGQAVWLTGATSVAAEAVTAPDGLGLADTVVESATTALHTLSQDGLSFTAGQTYALSVFARANGRERLQLVLPSTAFGSVQSALFDLIGGSIGTIEGAVSASLEVLADGWVRCSLVATATTTTETAVYVRLRNTTGVSTYAGDGTSGVDLWGMQLEAGGCPTSYIATEEAAVPRAADSLRLTLPAGTINPFEGTILARGTVAPGAIATLVDVSDGTADARLTLGLDAAAGTAGFTVVEGGTSRVSLSRGGVTGGTEVRVAAAYAAGDAALVLEAGTAITGAPVSVPSVTTLTLGGTATGTVGPRCWIHQVGVFPRRLDEADLLTLTA